MTRAYTIVDTPKINSNIISRKSRSPLKLSDSYGRPFFQQKGVRPTEDHQTNVSTFKGWSPNDFSQSKKRKTIMMDSSDGEHEHHTEPHNVTRAEHKGHPNYKKAKIIAHGLGDSKAVNLLKQRQKLPIWTGRDRLVKEVRGNDTVVILGETGSGKTTQVPQFLLDAGFAKFGTIACTQPRRVAATSLAERVAAEQNVALGTRVGYAVRFDEKCSHDTKIKYLTDGMLVRELLGDPMLSNYSVIIIDEAHERTLRTDFLLASLKTLQKIRNSRETSQHYGANHLKLLIMSATLDAERFSQYFDGAKILSIKGRQHPVKIMYTKDAQLDYCETVVKTFFQIHTTLPLGDVLVFLPGQEDIERLEHTIKTYAQELPSDQPQVIVRPMYASLASHLQEKVFHSTPHRHRKCVLATNIAETSITIPGIKYVIDTGLCKEKSYITRGCGSAIDSLLIQPISKSSAMQRAGRAGRLGEGVCFRLYTEAAYNRLRDTTIPEIQRCNLTSAMLELKYLGKNPEEIEFMDALDPNYVKVSLFNLYSLGALNNQGFITPVGRQMAMLPLEPSAGRALLAAQDNDCVAEVLSILSITSASSKIFLDSSETREVAQEAQKKFTHPSGDHMTYLNVLRAYSDIVRQELPAARKEWCRTHYVNERTIREANDIFGQLQGVCMKMGIDSRSSCGDAVEPVLKSLVKGLHSNVAFLHSDGQYRQIHGRMTIKIHPSSTLSGQKNPCVFFEELVFTTQTYARGVSAISAPAIAEVLSFQKRLA